MIPYGHQWIEEDDVAAVTEVLRSDWLTTGPWVERFEGALAEAVGARYAVAVCNGTAALHLACLAAGVGPGDVVVTSPITFVASANCALYCGAMPIFVDIDPETRNLSPVRLRHAAGIAKFAGRPLQGAVIPVHYAGLPCALPEVAAVAGAHGLVVIEDACHALGAEYRVEDGSWCRVGSCRHSAMAVFSFHPVKHITTGEGGAVTTNDPELYRRLLLLRNHGITRDPDRLGAQPGGWYYEQQELGCNYRLTDIQAALGLSQLRKLDRFVARRRALAALYDVALAGLDELLTLPPEPEGYWSAYHLYAVQLRLERLRGGRRAVYDALRAAGIGVQVHYLPVHLQPYYRDRLGYEAGDFPAAEAYYEGTLSLPMYPQLSDADAARVAATLRQTIMALVAA